MTKENQSPTQVWNPWGPEYKSQLGQDKFVDMALNGKRNGYFVDVGAAHPIDINNTHFLEKELSWEGLSIDMGPEHPDCPINWTGETEEEYLKMWEEERSTFFVCEDALKINYKQLFEKYNVPKNIDYLSIDLEPAAVTLECLLKIPFDEYVLKIITFEHDFYRNPDENIKIVKTAREFLSQYGYKALNFASLDTGFPLAGFNMNKLIVQEDWFLNTDYIHQR